MTEMTVKPFVVAPEDYASDLDIVGEHVTVLASGEATGGYEIFLQRGPEGSGPPPHSHPWDESFFVVKGQIDFGIGAESKTASPGTLVHLPAGTADGTPEMEPAHPPLPGWGSMGPAHTPQKSKGGGAAPACYRKPTEAGDEQ